jgi:hypothetical protein
VHLETRLRDDLEGDALGGVDDDRMRETQRELELGRALRDDPVADADDLEVLLVAIGDADDHVVDQCPAEAVQRLADALVVGTFDDQLALVVPGHGDGFRDGPREFALRPLHGHVLPGQSHLNTGRNGDGEPANS